MVFLRPRRLMGLPALVLFAAVTTGCVGYTASLGLTFDQGSSLQPPYRGGAFVGQHGSWNRSVHSGYKVIFVPFRNGKPASRPKDILTGFIGAGNKAMGRPVGVTFDKTGALLVADDVGNVIWRVTPARRDKRAGAAR